MIKSFERKVWLVAKFFVISLNRFSFEKLKRHIDVIDDVDSDGKRQSSSSSAIETVIRLSEKGLSWGEMKKYSFFYRDQKPHLPFQFIELIAIHDVIQIEESLSNVLLCIVRLRNIPEFNYEIFAFRFYDGEDVRRFQGLFRSLTNSSGGGRGGVATRETPAADRTPVPRDLTRRPVIKHQSSDEEKKQIWNYNRDRIKHFSKKKEQRGMEKQHQLMASMPDAEASDANNNTTLEMNRASQQHQQQQLTERASDTDVVKKMFDEGVEEMEKKEIWRRMEYRSLQPIQRTNHHLLKRNKTMQNDNVTSVADADAGDRVGCIAATIVMVEEGEGEEEENEEDGEIRRGGGGGKEEEVESVRAVNVEDVEKGRHGVHWTNENDCDIGTMVNFNTFSNYPDVPLQQQQQQLDLSWSRNRIFDAGKVMKAEASCQVNLKSSLHLHLQDSSLMNIESDTAAADMDVAMATNGTMRIYDGDYEDNNDEEEMGRNDVLHPQQLNTNSVDYTGIIKVLVPDYRDMIPSSYHLAQQQQQWQQKSLLKVSTNNNHYMDAVESTNPASSSSSLILSPSAIEATAAASTGKQKKSLSFNPSVMVSGTLDTMVSNGQLDDLGQFFSRSTEMTSSVRRVFRRPIVGRSRSAFTDQQSTLSDGYNHGQSKSVEHRMTTDDNDQSKGRMMTFSNAKGFVTARVRSNSYSRVIDQRNNSDEFTRKTKAAAAAAGDVHHHRLLMTASHTSHDIINQMTSDDVDKRREIKTTTTTEVNRTGRGRVRRSRSNTSAERNRMPELMTSFKPEMNQRWRSSSVSRTNKQLISNQATGWDDGGIKRSNAMQPQHSSTSYAQTNQRHAHHEIILFDNDRFLLFSDIQSSNDSNPAIKRRLSRSQSVTKNYKQTPSAELRHYHQQQQQQQLQQQQHHHHQQQQPTFSPQQAVHRWSATNATQMMFSPTNNRQITLSTQQERTPVAAAIATRHQRKSRAARRSNIF